MPFVRYADFEYVTENIPSCEQEGDNHILTSIKNTPM